MRIRIYTSLQCRRKNKNKIRLCRARSKRPSKPKLRGASASQTNIYPPPRARWPGGDLGSWMAGHYTALGFWSGRPLATGTASVNAISRKPAHTVAELASARQHQKNWPAIMMERAVEGDATGTAWAGLRLIQHNNAILLQCIPSPGKKSMRFFVT